MKKYVVIFRSGQKILVYTSMKELDEKLPHKQFIRVHKSYIVSLSKIENLDNESIKIGTHDVPLSRNYRTEVMNKVIGNNLLKR